MEDILRNLEPTNLGNYMAYIIFFLSILALFLMPEKNTMPLYLTYAVIFAAAVDLLRGPQGELFSSFGAPLYGGGSGYMGFGNQGFGTLMIHVAMGLLPFIAGAMIRRRGRQGRWAMPVEFIIGFIGAIYTVGAFMMPEMFY